MRLSPEEGEQLRASARHLLVRASSPEAVRGRLGDPVGFDEDLWAQMAELGWLGIHLPEPYGDGGSVADLAIVLHELGRQLTASPMLSSAVVGAGALVLGDNPGLKQELLPGLADGTLRATVASASPAGSYDGSEISVRARRAGHAVRLSGAAGFVPDAHVADVVVAAARTDEGELLLVAVPTALPGFDVTPTPTVDATRRLALVELGGVEVTEAQLLCDPGARSEAILDRINALGAISSACDAVGVAERMMERTATYAGDRVQFGRPIGSFQAVKHHCANMAIDVVASRAAVDAAVVALEDPSEDPSTTAAVVKSYVGPACSRVCGIAVQVHGGIGFTWENDAHLYLKRAMLDEFLFGSPKWHRRRLAASLLSA
jgi:alkylation response protein AidB-like acyl-CoA dehydrogenase